MRVSDAECPNCGETWCEMRHSYACHMRANIKLRARVAELEAAVEKLEAERPVDDQMYDAALRQIAACRELESSPALADVLAERKRQDREWGEQNHDPLTYGMILVEEVGEFAQAALHSLFGGHAAIKLREEAIHTAAVALAIVESLDRGKWTWPHKEALAATEGGSHESE